MRVTLIGAGGQLGTAIRQTWADCELACPNKESLDLADPWQTYRAVAATEPELVVNAAAYTDVDGCESNVEHAYRINALAPRVLATACLELGCRLIHISTNCVFDGMAEVLYLEYDRTNPISVYGSSKLAGEEAVKSVLPRHYVVRTAWLYSPFRRNFVSTVLRLAHELDRVRMVADEVSSPTNALDLAVALRRLAETPFFGTYHFTNSGACSRFEFAAEILRLAGENRLALEPIRLAEYQRPSRPPLYSPLRNLCGEAIGITLRPWREALADLLPHMNLR